MPLSTSDRLWNLLAAYQYWLLAGLVLELCVLLGGVANISRVEADVSELMQTAAVSPRNLQCGMASSARAATCNASLSPQDVSAIVSALGLKRIYPAEQETGSWALHLAKAGPDCPFKDATKPPTFGVVGRPEVLRLSSGTAFEYLVIAHDAGTGQACIQVGYSYG